MDVGNKVRGKDAPPLFINALAIKGVLHVCIIWSDSECEMP